MRKLFHKALRSVTTDEDQLKELMVILDAHGKQVQDTHYILRDPEDDVLLAKKMVQLVLGGSKDWPPSDAVKAFLASEPAWASQLDDKFNGKGEAADQSKIDEGAESEDDELDYWEGGEAWGFQKPAKEQPQTLSELFALPPDFFKPKGSMLALEDSMPLAALLAGGGPAQAKKAKRPTPREALKINKAYYDKYEPNKGAFHQKTMPEPGAHNRIEEAVAKYQQENGLQADVLPPKDFFWDLRCQLIDEGLLSSLNCWDFCRSHIKNKDLKEKKLAGAAPVEAPVDVD